MGYADLQSRLDQGGLVILAAAPARNWNAAARRWTQRHGAALLASNISISCGTSISITLKQALISSPPTLLPPRH